MSFNNSSGLTINDGDLTNANRVYNNCNIHKVVATQRTAKRRTIWDDYTRVKPGHMRIEENVSTTSVRLAYRDDEEGRKQYRLWKDVDARRNIGIARLRGEDREDKFLCVTYDGPDALKAFRQDFNQFARIRNANIAQIFGYNDNEEGLPALVFYNALIPLARIVLDGDRLTPLLFSYFAHQFGRMQRELGIGILPVGQMWVDPRTGALQQGLYLELPLLQSVIMYGIGEDTMPNTHSTHLPIQTYSNYDTVFEYLTRTFPTRTILTGIRLAYSGFFQPLANEQVIPVLSSLPGAIYNRCSGDIIARLPGARERLDYGFLGVVGRIPDGMRESQVVMDDGSVRFTVTSTEIQVLQGIDLQYDLYPGDEWGILAESWVAQAHSVFSQLRIHEDDCEDYGIHYSLILHLERTSLHQEPNIPPKVYLFIRPVPRPSDDEAIWRSWVEGEKYFWSFDPFGSKIVSEIIRACSGLPSFACRIRAWHAVWSPGHYDAVQKLHVSEGFDSTTTDFALSLCFPILDVVGDESRFEDLEESGSDMSSLAGDDLEPRGESPTRASSAKKPRTAGRTLRSTRTRPRLQQLRARKPGMKSPGKPLVLAKQANRRRDVQAVLSSNRGATSTGQQSRGNGKVLGHRSTSTFSRVTSRPNKDQQESSSESLSSVEDHSEAQAGPSMRTSTATTGRYQPHHRETSFFVVPHTETGLQPPKSRKWKRVDDMDRVSSKKSHQIEDSQNNERKRRQPNERPKKRRRGL